MHEKSRLLHELLPSNWRSMRVGYFLLYRPPFFTCDAPQPISITLLSSPSNALFHIGADNVCVIGGDATQVLPQRIPSSSLDYLFINHPEPPQQTGGLDSQGKHLLTMVSERSFRGVIHHPHLFPFPCLHLSHIIPNSFPRTFSSLN